MDEHATTTAGEVLDQARRGSTQLLLAINVKTNHFIIALSEGRFGSAVALAAEIAEMTKPLAVMETRVAPFADTYLARAADLAVGVEIRELGVISAYEVGTTECPSGGPDHDIVTIKFSNGGEMTVAPQDELLVVDHGSETG